MADAPPLAERPWWARARSLWFLAAVGFAAVGGYFAYAFQRDERTLVSIDANRGAYRWAEELAADRGRKIDYGMLWGMFAASAGCGALVAVTW